MRKFILIAVMSLFSLNVYGGGVLAEGRSYRVGVGVHGFLLENLFTSNMKYDIDFDVGANFGRFEIGVFGGPTIITKAGADNDRTWGWGWGVGVRPFLNFMDNQAGVEHVAGLGVDLSYGMYGMYGREKSSIWAATPFFDYRWYFHEQASFNMRIGYPLYLFPGKKLIIHPFNIWVGIGMRCYF